MKKYSFFCVFVIMTMISCTKEKSFIYRGKPKDSTFVFVDYKPMPKASIPDEPHTK
ncbi:MAG: hypothetical protein ACHQF0_15210 [Chitinophagales bacterium]